MFFNPRDWAMAVTLAGLALFPARATALESSSVDAGKAQVRLIAASPLRAGVEIRLANGWHTYWRYPGDAGVPPRFDWAGSTNLASVDVRWPAPERIRVESGIESIGYERDVTFPLRIQPADASKPVTLRLKLDFGVCEKICIPATAKISLDIPAGLTAKHAALYAAEKRLPAVTPQGGDKDLRVISAKLERGSPARAIVEVAVPEGQPFDLFAEGPNENWALPLPKLLDAGAGRARFAVPIDGAPAGGPSTPPSLRLTLVAGDRAIETVVPLD
jgi:DsbC/DsbD-like thiol-disulfide interchange protein